MGCGGAPSSSEGRTSSAITDPDSGATCPPYELPLINYATAVYDADAGAYECTITPLLAQDALDIATDVCGQRGYLSAVQSADWIPERRVCTGSYRCFSHPITEICTATYTCNDPTYPPLHLL